ncbi:polysaccharide biosynthesis tyrosine autokinase [Lelliottia sp. V106_10]|uniref:polysaccharide biosynthesis tyrosine autokinase n=1 Tax=Lelliottia wanjuensis TaxID=3050585 RepID=UPI002550A50B|nr:MULTISPECIES: polysaccharide biosynthesis tyrosine autokinase [unclassified Lelliottia]MDK9357051.1 polysaccharide biosynthesis tyrosine autokinase [Lelliottia sp. V106_16]MDK9372277.1 polysaccharide biosynthesis tyrosine autokinase [Lelliottia sp. V106_10]MDK9599081.1 polysaccharide biosynthesis tyrosine autokinase [Lelliottia sp. V106_5]
MSSYTSDIYAAANENHELDLARLLGEMIDHRLLILCITFLFTACAALYAFTATPVFRADAMVQIESKQDNSLLKNLSQLSPELSPDAMPEIQLLKSRMILGQTVDGLRLNEEVKQRYFPLVGRALARLFGQKPATLDLLMMHIPSTEGTPRTLTLTVLDPTHFRVTGDDFEGEGVAGMPFEKEGVSLWVKTMTAQPGARFALTERTKLDTINALNQQFTVAEAGKQSGVLNLSLTGTDPDLIAKVLNSIAENYLRQNIDRQAAQDAKSLAFLQRQLPQIRGDLDVAEERLNVYRKQRDSVDLTLEAKSVLEQIVNADNQLNELTFREAEISQLFKKDHPTYRALMEKRQTLESEKARLNQRVSAMPSTQQEILRLSRDVDSGREIYQQLLTRQQELSISRSSAIGNVRIIDPAVTQPESIKPTKPLVIVMGFMLGLIISAGLVLGRAALKRGIESPDQLENQGITVLATLPRSVWLWKKTRLRGKYFFGDRWTHRTRNIPFLPVDRPVDLFVEAIRGLRTSLHFTMLETTNRVVMFTGPTQNCGKTLVSTSLAAIVAQTGQKVLFIDADMRKGYVHQIFGLTNRTGLSDVLSGKIDYQSAIQRYLPGEVDVMTCGQTPGNPSELLIGEPFQQLLKWANEHYTMVIVDTPPILAVTDASLVGRKAGTTLLVARFGMTSVKEVQACSKRLQLAGVAVDGAILNDVIKSAALYYAEGYAPFEYSYSAEKEKNVG